MNLQKLKAAEKKFLAAYPGGFANPVMAEIAKKHKIEKMHSLALESFAPERFADPGLVTAALTKIVSQSSMVSVFEKVAFRNVIPTVPVHEQELLASGLHNFLHGDQEIGFQIMTDLLGIYKLAKWTLLTVCPYYYRPETEVFIQPTTAKGIIANFELEGLTYTPRPNFPFYRDYRAQILEMKKAVGPVLGLNDTAAFCGFLMMSREAAHRRHQK